MITLFPSQGDFCATALHPHCSRMTPRLKAFQAQPNLYHLNGYNTYESGSDLAISSR
jgi:hypothetical protein